MADLLNQQVNVEINTTVEDIEAYLQNYAVPMEN